MTEKESADYLLVYTEDSKMTRIETTKRKRFHEVNDDGTEIYGDVPMGMRMQLALEPCEELNGKSVLDLAMLIQSNEVVDFDDWLENTVAMDFSDAFLEFA